MAWKRQPACLPAQGSRLTPAFLRFPADASRALTAIMRPHTGASTSTLLSCRVGGRLACLDLSSPALHGLIMPGLELPRTVLESELGQPLADVSYFAELGPGRRPTERLFVTVPGLD